MASLKLTDQKGEFIHGYWSISNNRKEDCPNESCSTSISFPRLLTEGSRLQWSKAQPYLLGWDRLCWNNKLSLNLNGLTHQKSISLITWVLQIPRSTIVIFGFIGKALLSHLMVLGYLQKARLLTDTEAAYWNYVCSHSLFNNEAWIIDRKR